MYFPELIWAGAYLKIRRWRININSVLILWVLFMGLKSFHFHLNHFDTHRVRVIEYKLYARSCVRCFQVHHLTSSQSCEIVVLLLFYRHGS